MSATTAMSKLDLIDRKILAELLRDAAQPVAQIAERVGLSQTPCWKRIQRLEREGVVTGRVAVVDPARLGLGLTAFVSVVAPEHSPAWRSTFAEAVAGLTEVVEVFRVAGEFDYLLRVVVADITAFDDLYKRLTHAVAVKNVTSHFAMERLKSAPIDPLGPCDRLRGARLQSSRRDPAAQGARALGASGAERLRTGRLSRGASSAAALFWNDLARLLRHDAGPAPPEGER